MYICMKNKLKSALFFPSKLIISMRFIYSETLSECGVPNCINPGQGGRSVRYVLGPN